MVAIFTGLGTGFERGSGSLLGSLGLLGSSTLGRGGEQLFFNAATGNLMVSQRDEYLVGLGLDAAVSRTYNSFGDFSDDNGDNWRQGYDRRITNLTGTLNTAGSTVQRVSGDGSVITYSWDTAKSAYVATDGAGAYDKLTSSGGVWTWTDGDSQLKESYAAYGGYWRLTSQADTDGNTISFTYTGDKLTQVTTTDGSTLTYSWSGNNLTQVVTGYTDLATSTAKTLTRTRYSYDGQGRLSSVTVDLSPEDNSIADGKTYVTTYTYDGTSTRVASIAQSDGSLIAITYDGSNRVATLTQTASTGVTRLTSISYGAGYTQVTDPLGLVTRLDYDAKNQLTKITLPPPAAGAAAQTIDFFYNSNGDVTQVKDALGNSTSYSSFDAYGNAQTITDRLGNVTTRTFGSKNELLTETRDASDTTQFSRPVTTRYVYDSENHLRFLIGAEGNVTEYRYTASGLLTHAIDYPEHVYDTSALTSSQSPTESQMSTWLGTLGDQSSIRIVQTWYDTRGNITHTRTIGADAAGAPSSTLSGLTDILYAYDQAGNLRSRYAQGRNTETFVYDGLNRLTASVDVNGATTTYVFNDANTTTTVTYATGLTQVSTYNKAGELISFAETAAPTAQQAWTGTATYGYDKDGRLRWQLDATGRKSYFAYDQRGRKIADVSINGDVVQYRYDANDRLVAQISFYNALDPALVAALDNADAAINLADVSPAAHGADIWQWRVYDKEGRLIRSIEGDGATVELTYDQSGQLLSTTSYYNILSSTLVASFKAGTATPDATTRPTADAARDSVARNFYDKAGRLVGVLDGEGYLTKFAYDQAGQKTRETHYFNPTGGNRATDSFNTLLASITLDSSKDRNSYYSYDGQGHLRYIVDSLGYVTETNYDSAGQATSVTQYAIALPATSDYTFDNVKSLVASGGLPASVGTRTSYTVYDTAGRPAYVIDPEGTVTANSYNAAGQLTKTVQFATPRTTTSLPTKATMDSWSTTNGGNAANRVNRFYYDGAGVLRYTIDGEGYLSRTDRDAEGRVVMTSRWANAYTTVDDSKTINDVDAWRIASGGTVASTSTSYDLLGRVEYVTDAEGIQTRYWYRYNGQLGREFRGWGTADATTTAFWYDTANRLIGRTDAYETPEAAGTGYTYDGLGNVLTVTDPNGQVTTNSYDRRGQLIKQKDALLGETNYQYDAFGSAVKVTDPRGFATFNYYDRRGLLVASRDAENYVTETSYTAFGQADTVIRRYNKATGTAVVGTLPTVSAHASDASTHFDYDRRGLVTKVTDAEGYYEQYTLDAFGNRASVRNKVGGTVTNSYDRRGLLVSETLPMAAYRADGTVEASSVTNTFEYDARGNRTRMIEAYGLTEQRTTNYSYDKVDRLKTRTLGAVATVGFNDFTSTTGVTVTSTSGVVPTESYDYDALGRLKQVTSALGGRTVSFYDHLGRKTAEVSPVGTLSSWTYDANGNMLTARVYGDAVTVPALTASAPPAPVNASNYRETVYTYDNINRLKTTSIANVLAGTWNGTTGVAPTTQTITTSLDYDANGNVIKATDANGNATYAYFDGLGRKTGQVDAENYITTWTYDGEGNVKKETRYATQYVGTPPTGGTTAPTVAADATNDRVTDFTYDRNGRRLTEARANVKIATVNATNGAITESTVTSTISYTYNGLGQVLTKAEGTGDTVTYSYDATGRLTKEARASYADQGGATVTPTVDYLYNGLNDLARTRQGGATANAGDRITTYAYGANGRLSQVVDPAGATHNYDYDAAGNIMRDWYVRTKSDGTTQVTEGILYRRDLLGRVIGQAIATKNSDTSWTRGDGQNSEYNAYGDMARRGINGLWQETFAYNNRGLVEKSNSGDGVWRFFVYDKNGNQTLAIEDENYTPQDLSTKTLSQVLGYLGATAGATFVDGLNVTIATYDKRGQALSSILTQRELSATGAKTALTTSQAYNAFGEVKSQTDARGYTSDFTYNTMGRLTKKELPSVSWTSETGVVASARPTEQYYYDKAGRLVASRDANGNLLSRTLLAGSGYGEAEALVTSEFHADGGIAKIFYDQFGDARILRNELGYDETRTYDAMGRLLTQVHRGGLLTDTYVYDILGQRTRHWNSLLGSGNVERTDYDLQGRVVSQVAFGGDTTTTSYTWLSTLATGGMATYGGWQQVDTYANSKTMTVKSDIFGRDTSKTDLGGHVFTYTYDKAGRQVTRATTGETLTTTWLNTGLVDKLSFGASDYATYSYDANGNHLTEYTVRAGTVAQNATASYDALNRMVSWAEAGGTTVPAASKSIEYDLNGNIRRSNQMVWSLDEWGATNPNSVPLDSWYAYDAMNRVVITDAKLSNGQYVPFVDTSYISYDLAGRRVQVEHRATKLAQVANPNYQPPSGGEPGVGSRYKYISYTYKEREDYSYNANDTMATVRIGATTYSDNGNGTATFYGPPAVGALKGSYTYDTMGRVTHQIDWIGDGTNAGYDRTVTYNTKGQISAETDITKRKVTSTTYDTYTDNMTYSYGTGTGYALGQVVQVTDDTLKNGSDSAVPDTLTTNAYAWYSSAVQSSITFDGDTGSSSNPIYTTTFTNSPSGILTSAYVGDNRPRTVTYVNDMDGMTIRRQEADNISTEGDPLSIWYRFNGREVASTNNRGNVNTTTYQGSITARTGAVQPTNPYTFTAVSIPDGDLSYEAVNSYKQGSAGGRYTARAGDTLEGIAQSVWGDSSLWYKIAEANGLSGGANLSEGQSINLPSGVTRSKNNANTYKPYDTAEAVGDVSPTTPKPPKKNKCGFIGQVLIAAVAIAVSVALGPEIVAALQPLFGTAGGLIVGGAVTGAVSSVASQGVGIATGIQDGFSWKGVAIAALAGAIGGGLGKGGVFGANGAFGNVQSSFVRGALQGAAGAALSNGIGVITGLQPKFSWAGVAAAAASGGIGGKLEADARYTGLSRAAQGAIGGSARLIASAATRSVIEGSDFGDNLLAGLPDVIAQTIGGIIEDGVAASKAKEAVPSLSLLKALGLTIEDIEGGQKAQMILAAYDPKSDKNYAALSEKIKAMFSDNATAKKLTGWYVPSDLSKSQDIAATQKVLEAMQRKGIDISDEQLASTKFVTGIAKAGLQYVTYQRFNYAYNTLTQSLADRGVAKPGAVAAGIVANLWVESGHTMDPSVSQMGGGGGEGIAQWTTSTRKDMFAKIEGVSVLSSSLKQQLDFLMREMTDEHLYVTSVTHTQRGDIPIYDKSLYNAGQKVMAATTASAAAIAFVARFERPKDTAGQKPVRSAIANSIFNYVTGKAQGLDDFRKIILGLKVA